MALIDDLRKAADNVPVSHIPAVNEVLKIVGAALAFIEHGDSFFKAAEQGYDEVGTLLAEKKTEQAAAPHTSLAPDTLPAGPAAAPDANVSEASATPTVSELEAENAALRQQLATAEANQQKTTGTVEPAVDEPEPTEPPAPPAPPGPPEPPAI